jgi:starch-binding outer membrane protein, SusD/RagB family
MKKLLFITCIIIFASACEVLDVEPQNSIPAESAFKDKAGIERGILGAYNGLQSLSYYGRTYCIFSDLAADNLIHPSNATAVSYSEVDNNAILPENESVDGIWSAIYDAINVANNVIVKVPDIADMSAEEKNKALGELYFLRALHHFNLVNYFGAVPIKITPTIGVDNVNAARNSVEEVYAQIITDLQFASTNLSASTSTKIRASKQAANAILARVYLYKKDYQNAFFYANEVIENGGYTLGNYENIFSDDGAAETIFEVDFNDLDRNRIAEYNFPLALNGRREVAPSEDLLSAFEPGDFRKNLTVEFSGSDAFSIKYDDLSIGADNFIVVRLAEMYLIKAEAAAKSGGDIELIQDDLNTIRARAGLPNTNEGNIDVLVLKIEKERRLEFTFEGHRWFDLVRTGRAIAVLPTINNLNQTLFPIPLSELLSNTSDGMTQNPGY